MRTAKVDDAFHVRRGDTEELLVFLLSVDALTNERRRLLGPGDSVTWRIVRPDGSDLVGTLTLPAFDGSGGAASLIAYDASTALLRFPLAPGVTQGLSLPLYTSRLTITAANGDVATPLEATITVEG